MPTKRELWHDWPEETLLADIRASDTLDLARLFGADADALSRIDVPEELEQYRGPCGHEAYLAAVEPLLIEAASNASHDRLLNHDGVADTAPVNTTDHQFEPVETA